MIFISSSVFASPAQKLERGFVNILVSPAEIQRNAVDAAVSSNPDFLAPIYGTFYGMTKGAGFCVARLTSGVIDVLTFPINFPSQWKQAIPIEDFSAEKI